MKTIGFPISHKENEFRRSLIPEHIGCIQHSNYIYVESGYGDTLGYTDEDYLKQGIHICSHKEVLKKISFVIQK